MEGCGGLWRVVGLYPSRQLRCAEALFGSPIALRQSWGVDFSKQATPFPALALRYSTMYTHENVRH